MRDGDEFALFFAPCRKQRGIGIARSKDLTHWYRARYLASPQRSWMLGPPNAAMVIDTRAELGVWLMVFHTDEDERVPHSGVLGLAWSRDLTDWQCP